MKNRCHAGEKMESKNFPIGLLQVFTFMEFVCAAILCSAQQANPLRVIPPVIGYEYILDIRLNKTKVGVVVDSLLPASPTKHLQLANAAFPTKRSLRAGDQITHVNGRVVKSGEDLRDSLNASDGHVQLTIIESGTMQTRNWNVTPVAITVSANRNGEVFKPKSTKPILFAVLIADTQDATIGNGARISMQHISDQLNTLIKKDQLELTILKDDDCNPQKIIRTLGVIPSTEADSIFVYYLGHGAFDPRYAHNDPSRGNYLDFKKKDLLRQTIWNYLNAAPAKLRVVVTDACNVEGEADPSKYSLGYRTKMLSIIGPTGLEWLLLGHRGQLDLSAADVEQFAWYSNQRGGFFSNQWVKTASDLSLNNWGPFLTKLSTESNNYYVVERARILANPGNVPLATLNRLREQTSLKSRLFQNQITRDQTPPVDPQLKRNIADVYPTAALIHENQ